MSRPAGKDAGAADGPIAVRVRFERFPLSVKGAFVMRGADGDPHSVQFDWGRLARVPTGPTFPFPVESRQFDVSPTRELFVPFEASIVELRPGWYRVESSLTVDGAKSWEFAGRAFAMPWARNEVLRASVPLGQVVRAGGSSFHVERVDLTGDSAGVVWRSGESEDPGTGDPSAPLGQATLVADGATLELLPGDAPAAAARSRTDQWRTLAYPVPRSCRSLAVVIRLRSGEESSPVKVPLL